MKHADIDKDFQRQARFVRWFICGVFVLMICFFAFYAVLAYKAAALIGAQDWQGGIKPLIEQLWCGAPGCLGK